MTRPNFIVAGFKKAATTSIYEYLQQHPQVFMTRIKETKFFLYEPDNPEHVAASLKVFPVRSLETYTQLFAEAGEALAIGEASPGYAESRKVAIRIHAELPQVKLIFSLRNPVDRAYSNYLMGLRNGVETRPAHRFFAESRARLQTMSYYNSLKIWYELFPRDQIKIVMYEELRRNGVRVMQEIYRYLGVDEHFAPDVSVQHNTGGVPKSQARQKMVNFLRRYRYLRTYIPQSLRTQFSKFARGNLAPTPSMSPEVRQLLTDLYRDDVQHLQELIQKDLSPWGFAAH
jgi:hypothetical protein